MKKGGESSQVKRQARKPSAPKQKAPEARELDAREKVFVDEYLIDLDPRRAALAAGYSVSMANSKAYQWVSDGKAKPHVYAAAQVRIKEREKRTEITQDLVLQRWWEIANADAAELTAVHYRCCRHCYGERHAYQWIDEAEYERAVANAEANEAPIPSDEGGYGFIPTLSPNAKCPKCFGEGHVHVHLADTRKLSPAGRLLFDGVKETKFGVEVKVQDRAKALENVARHLGMFKTDVNLGVQENNPLGELLSQLAGKTLKPRVEGE